MYAPKKHVHIRTLYIHPKIMFTSEFSDISDLCILMNILEYTTHALLKKLEKILSLQNKGVQKPRPSFKNRVQAESKSESESESESKS